MVDNLARAVDNSSLGIQIAPASVKWCSVSLSEMISRDKRLEASVFDVEAKQAHDVIQQNKFGCIQLLGEKGIIENAYYPGRFKRIYCDKGNGEPFLLPSQMADINPKPEKWISRLTKCDISELRLKEKSMLLTRSGTIAFVSKTIKGAVFSDDVIRITFKKVIDLGYTYTFLKSKIGNKVLTTNGYGSVITHLEPEHLKNVSIPNAPIEIKEKIHNLIVHSYKLRDESNDLIDEATKLLIDELHLPDISVFKNYTASVETFGVKLSKINGRIDASYHLPIVDSITAHLRKYAAEVTTVGDKRISNTIILPGRFKRVYVDEKYGRALLGGKQIGELCPSVEKYLSVNKHNKRIKEQLEIRQNTILITRSGTIGKTAFVPKHWENCVASEHIIRVIPSSEDIAGYLYIFLASEYGHQLITRFTYGSVVDEIDDTHVSQIAVPLLKNKEIQSQINALALAANEKRYEAYKLEQQALTIMDEKVIFAK